MQTFKHKTILITGASSGIGAAMARQLADPTVTLLLTARSEDALQAVATEVETHGTTTAIFPHDLAVDGAAATLHQQITEAGFTADVLINNAGFGKQGPFEEYDAENYMAMIRLNVMNLVALTHRCLPAMLDRGDAGILNVSSTAGYQPLPYFAVYGATKSFVTNFSEALSGELALRGVTVSCLCPGPTDTAFQDRAAVDLGASKPFETPEKVARVGLRALLNGRMTAISGATNALGAVLGRVAPRRVVVALIRRVLAPQ